MTGPVLTNATSGIPVFQAVHETAQGGFTLDDSGVTAGVTIKAGTLVGFDAATRKAKVAKMGVLQANAGNTDVTYKVLKGSNLAVGMSVNLTGGTARAITVIDTAGSPDYNLLTVGTTIGVAAVAGAAIFVTDIAITAPKGLLYSDTVAGGNVDIAVVIRGTVYHRRIPPVPASSAALMPNIIFSESY